jgi:hypothetical protein
MLMGHYKIYKLYSYEVHCEQPIIRPFTPVYLNKAVILFIPGILPLQIVS